MPIMVGVALCNAVYIARRTAAHCVGTGPSSLLICSINLFSDTELVVTKYKT